MKTMKNFDISFINAISDFQILKIRQLDCHIFLLSRNTFTFIISALTRLQFRDT